VVVTTRITPGLDGARKQSKTLSNFVAIDDDGRSMFGKVMSLPDSIVRSWFEVYTTIPLGRIESLCGSAEAGLINPREAKLELARAIVERWHGEAAAEAEAAWFEATFSRRDFPTDTAAFALPAGTYRVIDLISRLASDLSRQAIRRLATEGAIEADGARLDGIDGTLEVVAGKELLLKLGRRRFFRVVADAETRYPSS
jgi:tyrosyl-tRNA synthetase